MQGGHDNQAGSGDGPGSPDISRGDLARGNLARGEANWRGDLVRRLAREEVEGLRSAEVCLLSIRGGEAN
jgi:hypothetical protein